MKKVILTGIALLVFGATLGIAQESKTEGRSGMRDTMQQMMKQRGSGEGGMEGMGGMMEMMKMMEQCSDMMKSANHQGEKAKENQKK